MQHLGNDIRGIYGHEITEELFYYIGKGYIKYLSKHSGKKPEDMWVIITDVQYYSPGARKGTNKRCNSNRSQCS